VISKTYSVPDVSCGHCKAAIEKALGQVAGIESVAVDVEGKTVAVSFDEARVAEGDIARTLADEGYPVAA
jgi:copper ion binding protein